MKSGFDTELTSITKELELSTSALREKFSELLVVENIQASEIISAYATFGFLRGRLPTSCYIEVITIEGKKAEIAVDSLGRTAEVLHAGS
jgi:hypothetical protein